MEYTLEDAFDTLNDTLKEREKVLDDLTNTIANNEVRTLNSTSTLEEVEMKQHKLSESLLKQISKEQPKDYPLPETSDLRAEVLKEMEDEIRSMEELLNNMKTQLSDIQEDITYLNNKKAGLHNMQKAYLAATEEVTSKTYENERSITKRLFVQVRKDLKTVVDTMFPDNEGFADLLSNLTSAYTKGGDDIYVDVQPEVLDCVRFLLEADIAMYHPNDKSKIRLADLL